MDDCYDQENNKRFCKIHITVIQYQCDNFCVLLQSLGSCMLCQQSYDLNVFHSEFILAVPRLSKDKRVFGCA